MRWLVALATLLALLGVGAARAQDVLPVPPLSGRVIDQTGTLAPSQAQALSAKLEAIETQRGAQVVVVLVPTTAPEDIASYTQRLGEQYKIGRASVGDGLLIVVAKNDRRITIAPAKTLEGAVPDTLANRIIAEDMAPAFRAGDYAGGLNRAVDRIGQAIAGEALPAPSPRSSGRTPQPSHGLFNIQDLAIFLFVGVPILGGILTRLFGRKGGALLTGGAVGGIGWLLTTSLLVAGGAGLVALFLVGVMGFGGGGRGGIGPVFWGGGFGGGGFGGGGRGGGGGFSSGGGGDFGGGGASGSW
jgi:uncharacterized protein